MAGIHCLSLKVSDDCPCPGKDMSLEVSAQSTIASVLLLADTAQRQVDSWKSVIGKQGDTEQMPPAVQLTCMETSRSYFKGTIWSLLSTYLFLFEYLLCV